MLNTVGNSISTVEAIQYCGGIASVHWGIASVLQRLFSTMEVASVLWGYHQYMWGIVSVLWRDSISTVETVQYCGE